MFATKVHVGYVDDQFIRDKVTARATVAALAHITTPSAIVRCALS